MRADFLSLSFSGELQSLEDGFREDYFRKSLKYVRFSLVLGSFFYGVFGLLDTKLVSENQTILRIIRYGIVCPSVLVVFLFSFSSHFNKHNMQALLAGLMTLAGLGIIAMIVVIPPPVAFSYYPGLILVFMFGYTVIRLRFEWATLVGWIIVICYQIAAIWISKTPFLILTRNNFFFVSANIIGMVAAYIIESYARKDYLARLFIRRSFGRYLSKEVVEVILDSPKGLSLGGQRRTVTILMSDLRGFTSISEDLEPEQVVQLLNGYFEVMIDVIERYKGTVNEIVGDSLLVVFGAPQELPAKTQSAIACAITMQNAMAEVNERNRSQALPELEMGIGLNEADVILGNIGSIKRSKYAVVGSGVNMTSRIESFTVGGQILISESVKNKAGEMLRIDRELKVLAKGAGAPLVVYEVGGIAGSFNLALEARERAMVTLKVQIAIRCKIISGKQTGSESIRGFVVRLSRSGAEALMDESIDLLADLEMNLVDAEGELPTASFYGKVVEHRGVDSQTHLVRFTALPSEIGAILQVHRKYAMSQAA